MEPQVGQSSAQKKEETLMVPTDGVLKVADLPKVYANFKKEIDTAGLQSSKAAETQKGYDTLGYGYAWISERLNDVVGPQCWRMVVGNEKHIESSSKAGNRLHEIEMEIVIELGNWESVEREEALEEVLPDENGGRRSVNIQRSKKWSSEFRVIARSPIGFGWHRAMNIADARKGAMTNGFKKAAGFLGLGNEAYKKGIDEENQAVIDALQKKKGKSGSSPARGTLNPNGQKSLEMVNAWMEKHGAMTIAQKVAYVKTHMGLDVKGWAGMSLAQVNLILAKIKSNPNTFPSLKAQQ